MRKKGKRFETLEDIEKALQSRKENKTGKTEKGSGIAAPKGVSGENDGNSQMQGRKRQAAMPNRKLRRAHGTNAVHGKKNARDGRLESFFQNEQWEEYGRMLMIPLIAVLLMAVILLLDNGNNESNANKGLETESTASQAEQPVTEAAEEDGLPVCEIPEIRMLVSDYFSARLSADTDRLYEIFGRKEDNRKEKLAKLLKTQASWIQSYENIEVYALPGKEQDARLCIITYDIDFRRTDTLAPGIMYSYVQRDADGNYIIAENLRKETRDYINEKLEEEPVVKLRTEINNELQNHLAKDSTLALIYTSFLDGKIYNEADLAAQDEQEVNLLTPENSDLVGGLQSETDSTDAEDGADSSVSVDSADGNGNLPADDTGSSDGTTDGEIAIDSGSHADAGNTEPAESGTESGVSLNVFSETNQ